MKTLNVNGDSVEVEADDTTPLLWALREQLGLTGTKYGCGIAQCGSCTVHLDGVAVRSCVLPLAAVTENTKITTIEGLSRDRSHPVQHALVAEQAIQCGFCTPGIAMAASALLAKTASPSEAEIKAAIPNLCRCGVYPRMVRAIERAGRVARRAETISAAPAPGINAEDAAREVPAISAPATRD